MIMEMCTCRKCGIYYLPVYDDSVVQTGLCYNCYLEEKTDDKEEPNYD